MVPEVANVLIDIGTGDIIRPLQRLRDMAFGLEEAVRSAETLEPGRRGVLFV